MREMRERRKRGVSRMPQPKVGAGPYKPGGKGLCISMCMYQEASTVANQLECAPLSSRASAMLPQRSSSFAIIRKNALCLPTLGPFFVLFSWSTSQQANKLTKNFKTYYKYLF
jgi:hypothetical protein